VPEAFPVVVVLRRTALSDQVGKSGKKLKQPFAHHV